MVRPLTLKNLFRNYQKVNFGTKFGENSGPTLEKSSPVGAIDFSLCSKERQLGGTLVSLESLETSFNSVRRKWDMIANNLDENQIYFCRRSFRKHVAMGTTLSYT